MQFDPIRELFTTCALMHPSRTSLFGACENGSIVADECAVSSLPRSYPRQRTTIPLRIQDHLHAPLTRRSRAVFSPRPCEVEVARSMSFYKIKGDGSSGEMGMASNLLLRYESLTHSCTALKCFNGRGKRGSACIAYVVSCLRNHPYMV